MSKKQAALPGAAPGQPASRLPVARSKAEPRAGGGAPRQGPVSFLSLGKAGKTIAKAALKLKEINSEKADLELQAVAQRTIIMDEMQKIKAEEGWTVRDEYTDWIATYVVPKESKKLVPELLVKAGVSTAQLAKGYKTVPAKKPYVSVRTANEDSETGEEE